MKNLILIISIFLLLLSCKSQAPLTKIIHGQTYDLQTGKGLNQAVLYNLRTKKVAVTDSIGQFSFTARIGDKIHLQYIGLKDSVIVINQNLPQYLIIGLDTVNTTIYDKGVHKIQGH